jgi:hypothetical protein
MNMIMNMKMNMVHMQAHHTNRKSMSINYNTLNTNAQQYNKYLVYLWKQILLTAQTIMKYTTLTLTLRLRLTIIKSRKYII